MSDWTASEAREFLSIIRSEAERVYREQTARQSSICACLAIVVDDTDPDAIKVRLLSSPIDGSQDLVVRNRSGSTLANEDSVWLHYWGDYTNAYIAVRNMGDVIDAITADSVGAISYTGAQTLTANQKSQARSNIGAEESILVFSDVSVNTSSWATYTAAAGEETSIQNAGFTYRKSLTLSGITSSMSAIIVASVDKALCGTAIHEKLTLFTDGAYIYAKATPTATFTLRKVLAITE